MNLPIVLLEVICFQDQLAWDLNTESKLAEFVRLLKIMAKLKW